MIDDGETLKIKEEIDLGKMGSGAGLAATEDLFLFREIGWPSGLRVRFAR